MTTFAPVHSSELNKLVFLGIDLSTGLAEDTYVTFTPSGPLTYSGTDAGGSERYISYNGDNSGKINVVLNAQSSANILLSQLASRSRRDKKPAIGDFYIERGGTLYLYQPKGCHLQERPTQSVGKDMTTVTNEWVFDAADFNEVDVGDFSINADLKADIRGSITASLSLSITL